MSKLSPASRHTRLKIAHRGILKKSFKGTLKLGAKPTNTRVNPSYGGFYDKIIDMTEVTDWDAFFKQQRKISANDPNTWLRHARSLKISADLVFAHSPIELPTETTPANFTAALPSLFPVYFMLVGLAIENLCKGIFITKFDALDKNYNLVEVLTHHDQHVQDLLSKCGLSLSLKHKQIIERLEQYVRSWGRYGIDKYCARKFPRNVSSSDHLIPRMGAIKKDAKAILNKNQRINRNGRDDSLTERVVISNFFQGDVDKVLIDEIFTQLEEILKPYASSYKPDWGDSKPKS